MHSFRVDNIAKYMTDKSLNDYDILLVLRHAAPMQDAGEDPDIAEEGHTQLKINAQDIKNSDEWFKSLLKLNQIATEDINFSTSISSKSRRTSETGFHQAEYIGNKPENQIIADSLNEYNGAFPYLFSELSDKMDFTSKKSNVIITAHNNFPNQFFNFVSNGIKTNPEFNRIDTGSSVPQASGYMIIMEKGGLEKLTEGYNAYVMEENLGHGDYSAKIATIDNSGLRVISDEATIISTDNYDLLHLGDNGHILTVEEGMMPEIISTKLIAPLHVIQNSLDTVIQELKKDMSVPFRNSTQFMETLSNLKFKENS